MYEAAEDEEQEKKKTHLIQRPKLHDLVRDLNLSKQRAEL